MAARLWGRDDELRLLDSWLDDREPGTAPLLVAGGAGMGKTALLAHLARRADEAGRAVLTARGVATGGAPALWLWTQVAGDLDGSAEDRYLLVERVLDRLAGHQPCVVLVDDVQWVDESSLRTLALVVPRLSGTDVKVALALRTHDAHEGWLAAGDELLSVAQPLRLDLGPLGDEAARRCLVDAAGSEPGPEVVDEALALAQGNAFYLTELGRTWRSGGALAVPTGLAGVVGQRVARLSPLAQELLHVAAVLGDDTDVAVAARCLGRDPLECLPAVQEAMDASLLVRQGAIVRFAHPLVRSALLASLSLQRLVALHRVAAHEIETLYADSLDDHAADLARLWAEVVVTGEREPAVRWSRRAGDLALAALAFEDAARLYTQALDCGGPSLDEPQRAALLRDRALADLRAGRMGDAEAACREAFSVARRTGDAVLLASVALTLDPVGDRSWDRPLRERCDEAITALGDASPALKARLLARASDARMYDGDWAGAAASSSRALAVAEESGDDEALVAACRARQLAASGPEGHEERVILAARMVGLGERLGRPDVEMWGRLWSIDWRWEVGDLAGVAAEIGRLDLCARRAGGPMPRWHVTVARSVLAQARGDLDGARALSEEAAGILAAVGHPAAYGALMALLAGIGHHRGHEDVEFPDDTETTHQAAEVRGQLFAHIGPAVALAESGRPDDARVRYRRAGPPSTWDVPPFFEVSAMAAAAIVAVELGLEDDARFVRRRLEPWRGRHLVGGAGVGNYLGPVELALGRCAALVGDLDGAEADLVAARAACVRIGVPGFGAECEIELAAVLASRGRTDEARRLVEGAAATAAQLGLDRLVARAEVLRSALADGRPDATGDRADRLTPREVEVAGLVAAGRSNREIAHSLVLSERTVANHVQHVLAKLGFERRTQIAAWWLRSEYGVE